ncbi:cadherin-like beta sandwich domain-containing protein [Terrimonas sp. NA20]|uniref:Cadherin-like beta sandwich domain-containing protein n=1 Tax=Terrimonas ginsenosidimutans TaxID=2908004 RepID=A0ABS9KK40_9BACT|nr:cadherin-like beta sandwich domain-containing protein [Terrimonas ginsenosidimutans]MCG2612684.1 cadherin-like beta sandwich domain-containing protein [Terrimonas ginsenosidimutans]
MTNHTLKGKALSPLLCALIITGVLLFSATITLNAQLTAYTGTYAGAGGNAYYAGDNNNALTAKFSAMKGLALDASGNLLVTDFQNACIRKITTDGKISVVAGIPQSAAAGTSATWPTGPAASTQIPYPSGHITVASNGDIYFQTDGFTIGKISGGNVSYFIPAIMSGTGSLARHNTLKAFGNKLYLGSGNSINVIDPVLKKQTAAIIVTGADAIKTLAIDASGNMFCIAANGQVSKVDATTSAVTVLVAANADPSLWVNQGDLAIDADGNLYMAYNFNYLLKVAAGTYTRSLLTLGGTSAKYISVAITPNGDIFAADQSGCVITRRSMLDANANLASLTASPGILSPSFSANTISYTSTVENNVDTFNVTPTLDAATSTQQVRINNGTYETLASGATSSDMNLNVGTNTINIVVSAQHPSYKRTYTITVTRKGLPPAAPTNLVTTPAANSVKITWDAVPGAGRYNVYRGTSPDNLTLLSGMPTVQTSFTNGATVGTTYYYAVSAMEPTGVEGDKTAVVQGAANIPPVISTLTVSGNFWEGATVTADYTYTDADNGPNNSTYLWYRSNNAAGTGKAFTGGTAQTYTLTTADVGKYISVRVAPNDGISAGTAIESARTLVVAGTLPVKLKFFDAKAVSGSVQLDWQTLTEINSLHFAIERSDNGRTWETIGRVSAAGDSYLPVNYSYTDRDPSTGNNYYRLRTVDRDGSEEISSTVQVNVVSSSQVISIYPIPASSAIHVKGLAGNSNLQYMITDADGKTIRTGSLTKPVQQIDIQDLKNGIYFLKAGNQSAVRFIKQ